MRQKPPFVGCFCQNTGCLSARFVGGPQQVFAAFAVFLQDSQGSDKRIGETSVRHQIECAGVSAQNQAAAIMNTVSV
jgi:hypothetical protein